MNERRRSGKTGKEAECQKRDYVSTQSAANGGSQEDHIAGVADVETPMKLRQGNNSQRAENEAKKIHGDDQCAERCACLVEFLHERSGPGGEHGKGKVAGNIIRPGFDRDSEYLRDECDDADKSDVTNPNTFGPILRIGCVIRSIPIDNVRVCVSLSRVLGVFMIIPLRAV